MQKSSLDTNRKTLRGRNREKIIWGEFFIVSLCVGEKNRPIQLDTVKAQGSGKL